MAQSDFRVAIIDTADDTRDFQQKLKNQGVEVVIRYLALGKSSKLANKRIIDNIADATHPSSEAEALLDNGFGIVLVYEWGNNSPGKFIFGVDQQGNAINTGPKSTEYTAIATTQANNDVDAAVAQATAIGLPDAPIYFTIDFDLTNYPGDAQDNQGNTLTYSDGTNVTNATAAAAARVYVQQLNARLGKARLGLYAGGWAIQQFSSLVTYVWVTQSRGFANSAAVLRKSPWHLFQQMDWAWFLDGDCETSLDIDTDIQNPSVSDIGAFGKAGPYIIDAARTQAIFGKRYVAVQDTPVYAQKGGPSLAIVKSCHNGVPVTVSSVLRNLSLRVIDDTDPQWLSVDLNEDGLSDGYASKTGFVISIKLMHDYS
ncbi:MAG TPA: glycoside hydrolase domain-containing protein [Xanthobacteraceae bacterium]|jgi:hypothetical protein|nr:glycoside hydrolase domain-containing protein [Xanthobacteraceae bacterium]